MLFKTKNRNPKPKQTRTNKQTNKQTHAHCKLLQGKRKWKQNEIWFQLLAFKSVFHSWLNVLVNRKSHGNNAGLKRQIFRILICRAGRSYQIPTMQILTRNQMPGRPLKAEEKREARYAAALNKLGT